jgi:hypothetical protein
MNVFEKSECFRAFLLLIGKDRVIAEEERMSMMAIGKKLDFEPRFCTNAINDLLENRHISIDPPRFRSRKLVESLLRDGLRIALADRTLHPEELEWLVRIAEMNGLDRKWVLDAAATVQALEDSTSLNLRFEFEDYL